MRDPFATFGPPPERAQSHFKIIETPLVFIAFLSIEVIWELSAGFSAALWGPREVLVVSTSLKERTSVDFVDVCKRPKWVNGH